jgi:perosamine synthetase
LRKADRLHQRRAGWAEFYTRRLETVEELILPRALPDRIHSWHLYPVRLRLERLKIDRGQFITALKEKGIGTSVHWMPLHMHPYYREKYGCQPADLPRAAALYPQLVSLPLYPDLTEEQAGYVADSVRDLIARHLK